MHAHTRTHWRHKGQYTLREHTLAKLPQKQPDFETGTPISRLKTWLNRSRSAGQPAKPRGRGAQVSGGGTSPTLAWLMRSPTKVETSAEPDMLPFLRISCFRNGKAAAGGSSGTLTVYDCRRLGMLADDRRALAMRGGSSFSEEVLIRCHSFIQWLIHTIASRLRKPAPRAPAGGGS